MLSIHHMPYDNAIPFVCWCLPGLESSKHAKWSEDSTDTVGLCCTQMHQRATQTIRFASWILVFISADWPHLGFFSRYTFFRKFVTLQRRGEAMIFLNLFVLICMLSQPPHTIGWNFWITNPTSTTIYTYHDLSIYHYIIIIYHLLFLQYLYLTSSYSILLMPQRGPWLWLVGLLSFQPLDQKMLRKGGRDLKRMMKLYETWASSIQIFVCFVKFSRRKW